MSRRRFFWLVKVPVFVGAGFPAAWLFAQLLAGRHGANPYEAIISESGLWSVRILVVVLLVTPLRVLSGWNQIINIRGLLGQFTAFYAGVHLVAWAADFGFLWGFLWDEIWARRFLTLGFFAALAMTPLAATSFKWAIRKLGGRTWRRLHRLVYPTAVLSLIHYLMARGVSVLEAAIWTVVLTAALVFRIVRWALQIRAATPRSA